MSTTIATRNSLSRDHFRLKLAGLVDEAQHVASTEATAFEAQAVDLALAMAELFGDDLDRITLWSRIASGLEQCARENAGDAMALVNGCLLHVKADATRTACNDRIAQVIEVVSPQSQIWGRQWARWIVGHIHIIIIKSRTQWQAIKLAKKEGAL